MICPVLSGEDALSRFGESGVSAFSPVGDRQSAYTRIKSEIHNLEVSISQIENLIRQWKSHHNSLSITSRLPDELLHHVFWFLDKAEPRWIKVTHVCSRWRSAALECPRLWSRPFFHNLECGNEMKRRAKGIPITLEVTHKMASMYAEQLQEILSNIVHAAELILYDDAGVPAFYDENMNNLRLTAFPELKLPAPFLERATLVSEPPNADFPLPLDILVKNSPNLRCLELKNWNLPWASSLHSFLGLTELHISFSMSHGAQTCRFPLFRVVSTLIRFRFLKSLSIDDMFLDIRAADIKWFAENQGSIKLPKLQKLDFKAKLEVCELFFSGFDWTDHTFVSVQGCWNGREPSQSTLSSTRAFLRTLGHRLPFPIRYLSLWQGDSAKYIDISIGHQSPSFTSPNPECFYMRLPPLSYLASDLLSLLQLSELERFNYLPPESDRRPLGEQVWANICKGRNLRWIHIAYHQPALLKLLASSAILPDSSGVPPPGEFLSDPGDSTLTGHCYFPALKILYLDKWEFWKPDPQKNSGTFGDDCVAPHGKVGYRELRDMLEFRRENSCKLDLINFWQCRGISGLELADLHDVCSKAALWKDEEASGSPDLAEC